MKNVNKVVEPGEMPCCPLCDHEILDWVEAEVVCAHGGKALVHSACAHELNGDE